jgi:hypothetical protein
MKLIYCIDEDYKNSLLSTGFKLMQETLVANKLCWVLMPPKEFNFSKLDNQKCFYNSRLFM